MPRPRCTCTSVSSPWIGLGASIVVCALAGAVIGFLAFRFGVGGVYFAILTIAFAEFARIGFDHFAWVRGSSGLFLPVANYTENDLWNLRGSPRMFYYLMLALTVGAFVLCHALLRSRMRLLLARDPREPGGGAGARRQPFRYKMVAVVLSAAMTSLAGVVFAFYYNNLFPEQIFHISRSIELILGPIIGGIGTLVGPIVGALLITGLAEGMRELMLQLGIDVPGVKQVFYGVCLLLGGDVPARRRVAAAREEARPGPLACSPSTTCRNRSAACARCTRRASRCPKARSSP